MKRLDNRHKSLYKNHPRMYPRAKGPRGSGLRRARQKILRKKGVGTTVGITSGGEENKPSYGQVAAAIRVGIMPKNHPESSLTVEQLAATKEKILEKIVELDPKATIRPKFSNLQFRPGWMLLSCADKATVEWLKSIIQELQPQEGISLRLEEESNIPHSEIFVTYLPDSLNTTNAKILRFLEVQNEDLNSQNWRVVRRVDKGPTVELTLSMDPNSAERVKQNGYKANYKFGQVRILPKKGHPKPSEPEAASTSEAAKMATKKGAQEKGPAKFKKGSYKGPKSQ
uniref:Uncharacterized protein LOC114348936 n=1 Tax=Diabrotica virgifera virgifera TaxID=50390 RepID=A0A6P7GZL4_DIAVI